MSQVMRKGIPMTIIILGQIIKDSYVIEYEILEVQIEPLLELNRKEREKKVFTIALFSLY
jgi:hypothetical protein